MVQAIINFGDHEDRILTIVKGKYGLKNKSEAVNLLIGKYGEEILEPKLRPEYAEKIRKIQKGKHVKFKDISDLRRQIGG